MYAYFIDDWVYDKHHRKLDRLDLALTQKGISGRKIKLARLHDLAGSIKDCMAVGIKTFVAIGNDTTASRILNNILSIKKAQEKEDFSFAFAFIAFQEPSKIANVFGYQNINQAAEALGARRTSKIDLGLLNDRHYFITGSIFPKKCSLGFKAYSVSSLHKDHHISVCNSNIYSNGSAKQENKFNVTDGVFEAVIAHRPDVSFLDKMRGKQSTEEYVPESIFPVKSITIKSKDKTINVFSDTEKQFSSPVKVDILPQELEIVIDDKF